MEYESRKLRTDIPVFDNHCHVCFPEPIEDTQRGFERYIQELGISALGILSAPRVRHTGMDVDILENLKVLYLKERLSVPVYAYAGFIDYSDDGEDYVAFAKSALAMGFCAFRLSIRFLTISVKWAPPLSATLVIPGLIGLQIPRPSLPKCWGGFMTITFSRWMNCTMKWDKYSKSIRMLSLSLLISISEQMIMTVWWN